MKLEKTILVQMNTINQYFLKKSSITNGHTFHLLPEMKLCCWQNIINPTQFYWSFICSTSRSWSWLLEKSELSIFLLIP